MTAITVEHNPDRARLTELGVYAWPIWKKKSRNFPGFMMKKKQPTFLKARSS
jgi:hypothetical protein